MNMAYWDGTFDFEYDSYDAKNYVECTDGKDTYVIDFSATCVASATGYEYPGSWDDPPYSEIYNVWLENMELLYCIAYKKTEDIEDILGSEEGGYLFVDYIRKIDLDNCDDKAKQLWDKLYVKDRNNKIPLIKVLKRVVEDYANDIAGDCDIDCFD